MAVVEGVVSEGAERKLPPAVVVEGPLVDAKFLDSYRLPVVVAVVLASSIHPMSKEPARMQPGDTIYVNDRTCGQGYARRVSVDENGERKRQCVKWSFFPAEIIGTPIR